MSDRTFEYLLNAMEHASQADHPDKMGYADKRKAVLEYVAKLEADRSKYVGCEPRHPRCELHCALMPRKDSSSCEVEQG
jgi:hypothetical protein